MSGFVALHLRPMRNHPSRALLSVSGVAVGIALMIAMLGLFSSLGSAAASLASFAGDANIEVTAPNDSGLPSGLLEQIAAIPGVQVAAPIVRSSVAANGATLLLIGIDQRLSEVGGGINLNSCLPAKLRAGTGILVGPGIADVASMHLATHAQSVDTNVLGRISCAPARRINKGRFIAAPIELAEALGGRPGRPDGIEVKAAPGTSVAQLTASIATVVAGRGIVDTPKLSAHQAKQGTAAFQQGTTVMVGLALIVGAFCVFNTVSMSALERRRELATLRAIGGHRRRLLRGFLGEMALLGVAGSILGVFLGQFAGTKLIGRLPPLLVDTVGLQPTFVLQRSMVVLAIVIGTVVTLGAALLPARNAVTVEPVEAMRSEGPTESATEHQHTNKLIVIIGLVMFIGGSVVAMTNSNDTATVVGFTTITLGSLVFQYGGRHKIAEVTAWVAERFGNSGRLAGASIGRAPRRTWATVTAVSVAAITAVAMGGVTANQIRTFSAAFRPMTATDVWIGATKLNVIPVTVRYPDSVLDTVRHVDGVESVVATQSSYTTIGKDRVLLEGIGGMSNGSQFAPLTLDAKRRILDPSESVVAVTHAFALRHHVQVGGTVTMETPTGPFHPTVIQITDVVTPSQTGAVVMNLQQLQRIYERPGITWIEAMASPGVTRLALQSRLVSVFADNPIPTLVATGENRYAGAHRSIVDMTQIVTAMSIAVVGGTALALGNALLISVIERKRELGIIRAIGTTRPQLRRMVVFESLAVAIVGMGLGGIQGSVQHRVADKAIESLLDARVEYHFTLAPVFAVSGLVLVVALLASIAPALRAARTNVIEAIGYE